VDAFFLVFDGLLVGDLEVSSVGVAGLAGGVDCEVEFVSGFAFFVDGLESDGAWVFCAGGAVSWLVAWATSEAAIAVMNTRTLTGATRDSNYDITSAAGKHLDTEGLGRRWSRWVYHSG
jgi:hypothetical protein